MPPRRRSAPAAVGGELAPAVPRTCSEIEPAWLTDALRCAGTLGDGRVAALDRERLGEGEGFMGEVQRLRLRYEPADCAGPRSLIAKCPIGLAVHRGQGELLGIYDREIRFYQELAHQLPVATPRHYFSVTEGQPQTPDEVERGERIAAASPAWLLRGGLALGGFLARFSRRRYVLLLEDLAPARLGDQVAGGSFETARLCLETAATLHAAWWGRRSLEHYDWLPATDAFSPVMQIFFRRARARFEARYSHHLSPHLGALADWLDGNLPRLAARVCAAPRTLTHGDYRLDNLFFRERAGAPELVLSDWQVPSRGPGVSDVAYFLTSSLDASASADEEAELVAIYHRRLEAAGVEGYPLDRCRRDYRLAVVWMLARQVSALAELDFGQERGVQMVELWLDRLAARLQGLDPESLMAAS